MEGTPNRNVSRLNAQPTLTRPGISVTLASRAGYHDSGLREVGVMAVQDRRSTKRSDSRHADLTPGLRWLPRRSSPYGDLSQLMQSWEAP